MIARRQSPKGMEMIGQNHHRLDAERMRGADPPESVPQGADMLRQQAAISLGQIDREEITTAFDFLAFVGSHGGCYLLRLLGFQPSLRSMVTNLCGRLLLPQLRKQNHIANRR